MQNQIRDEDAAKLLEEKPKRKRKKKEEPKPEPWVARSRHAGEVKTIIQPVLTNSRHTKPERPQPTYIAGPYVMNRRERRNLVRSLTRRRASFAAAARAFKQLTQPKPQPAD